MKDPNAWRLTIIIKSGQRRTRRGQMAAKDGRDGDKKDEGWGGGQGWLKRGQKGKGGKKTSGQDEADHWLEDMGELGRKLI